MTAFVLVYRPPAKLGIQIQFTFERESVGLPVLKFQIRFSIRIVSRLG